MRVFEPCEGERLHMVASDGHRLALAERAMPGLPANAPAVLLPFKGVAETRTLLESAKDDSHPGHEYSSGDAHRC